MKSDHKILFLNHSAQLGGAELSLVEIVKNYTNSSKVILLEDGPLNEKLKQYSVPTVVLESKLGSFRRKSGFWQSILVIKAFFLLIAKIRKLSASFDLLYANTLKSAMISMPAAYLARRLLIIHLRDILSSEHFSKFNIKTFVFLTKLFAVQIIANSQATAAAFIKSGGNPNKVVVIYNGFDISAYKNLSANQTSALRHQLEIQGTGKVIGCFSRISPWKGQDILLKAIKLLKEPVTVLIVGAPLFGEEAYLNKLISLASELGNEHEVKFLGFRNDIVELMQVCDLVVHPSVSAEPFGRAIVESMLLAKTVIASDQGGITEIIEDAKTGYLVKAGDVKALADTLKMCLNNPEKSHAVSLSAQESASSRFSRMAMYDGIGAIIDKTLGMDEHGAPRQ